MTTHDLTVVIISTLTRNGYEFILFKVAIINTRLNNGIHAELP